MKLIKKESYNESFIANKLPEMNVDTRLKISRSHKGKTLSDETKERLRKKNWLNPLNLVKK
jgi:hypothetical protein